jgi:hypothetical protein
VIRECIEYVAQLRMWIGFPPQQRPRIQRRRAGQGHRTAGAAPHGELLLVPDGDHLLGNAQGDWLPQTADRLTSRLGTTLPA